MSTSSPARLSPGRGTAPPDASAPAPPPLFPHRHLSIGTHIVTTKRPAPPPANPAGERAGRSQQLPGSLSASDSEAQSDRDDDFFSEMTRLLRVGFPLVGLLVFLTQFMQFSLRGPFLMTAEADASGAGAGALITPGQLSPLASSVAGAAVAGAGLQGAAAGLAAASAAAESKKETTTEAAGTTGSTTSVPPSDQTLSGGGAGVLVASATSAPAPTSSTTSPPSLAAEAAGTSSTSAQKSKTSDGGRFLGTFWTGNNEQCYSELLNFCTQCERTPPQTEERRTCCRISNPDSADDETRCNIRTASKSKCNDLLYNHHQYGGQIIPRGPTRPTAQRLHSMRAGGRSPDPNQGRQAGFPSRLVPPATRAKANVVGSSNGGQSRPIFDARGNRIAGSYPASSAGGGGRRERERQLRLLTGEQGVEVEVETSERHDISPVLDLATADYLFTAYGGNPLRALAEDYFVVGEVGEDEAPGAPRQLQAEAARLVFGREKFYCLIFLGGRNFPNYLSKAELDAAGAASAGAAVPDPNSPQNQPPVQGVANLIIFQHFFAPAQLRQARHQMALCRSFYNLKGENANEPDVHVCKDTIPKVGDFFTPVHETNCNVISIGIARNWIFEHSVLERGCRVWSFDPTMAVNDVNQGPDPKPYRSIPQILSSNTKRHPTNAKFYSLGIGASMGNNGNRGSDSWESTSVYNSRGAGFRYSTVTLQHIMKELAKIDRVHILRMDVEGAEVPVLNAWKQAGLYDKIDQLLMEVHVFKKSPSTDFPAMHKALVTAVGEKMDPFWINKNGHSPAVYEVGFLNRERFAKAGGEPKV